MGKASHVVLVIAGVVHEAEEYSPGDTVIAVVCDDEREDDRAPPSSRDFSPVSDVRPIG